MTSALDKSLLDDEMAAPGVVFGPALHLERITARGQAELDRAVEDEVVVPERGPARPLRPAAIVLQVHPAGQRLARLAIDDGYLELTTAGR